MSWFKLKAQPKDERPPLQGYGDQLEGWSGEENQCGGQSNRALLCLMKSLGEAIQDRERTKKAAEFVSLLMETRQSNRQLSSDPPQGGSVIVRGPRANPSIITEYGGPPHPRVDPDLIGDYYQ